MWSDFDNYTNNIILRPNSITFQMKSPSPIWLSDLVKVTEQGRSEIRIQVSGCLIQKSCPLIHCFLVIYVPHTMGKNKS